MGIKSVLLINMKICGGDIFVIFAGTIINCKSNIVSKICTTPFMCYCMISLLATQCSKCTDNGVFTLAMHCHKVVSSRTTAT